MNDNLMLHCFILLFYCCTTFFLVTIIWKTMKIFQRAKKLEFDWCEPVRRWFI